LEEYSEHVIVVSNIFIFRTQDDHPQITNVFSCRLKSPASHLLGCLGILRSGITHRAIKQAHEKMCVCLFTWYKEISESAVYRTALMGASVLFDLRHKN
jgi:hypothetical protein